MVVGILTLRTDDFDMIVDTDAIREIL